MSTRTRFGIFIAVAVTATIIGDFGTAIGMAAGAAVMWGIVGFVQRNKSSREE